MELRELVGRIGQFYDRSLGLKGEAQLLLRHAPSVLEGFLSGGLKPDASGGKGNAAVVPWIAVFNPEETETAQRGMYVVYLFAADMSTVALSLNQGVTELTTRFGTREGRKRLAGQAEAIRGALSTAQTAGMDATIDLRSLHSLPRDYEAGNILARTYSIDALPSEEELVGDLRRFIRLYEVALEVRKALRLSRSDAIVTTAPVDLPPEDAEFKPKSSEEYVQHIPARMLRKRRDHERLVAQYGLFLRGQGYVPNTKKAHPRDLTAAKDGEHWLIEAKMVYRGNGVQAARDAFSQLLMYRDFLYSHPQQVCMLALFSEDVGPLCVQFLERYHIASVWKDGAGWSGSPTAKSMGLTS